MKDSVAARISILGVGFIGRNLLNSYVGSGHDIRVLDRKSCPDEFCKNVHWTQGSLEESNKVRHAIKGADVVFHLISSTVPGDTADENEEIMNNVTQTINLLKLCVEENVQRIVFISSASVYGIKHDFPICETASTDPISSHGIHKLTIEKYLQLYKYKYGLDSKIMRLSNPYGWGQDVFGRQGLISITVGKILTGDPILIMGDGSAIRDFVYIDDVVSACHLLAETNSDEMLFNIGSGIGMSITDVFCELQKLTKAVLNIHHSETRKNDISASILDIRKAKNTLGFEAKMPFKNGLKRTLSLYEKRYPKLQEALVLNDT